jgi:hypothetical protein
MRPRLDAVRVNILSAQGAEGAIPETQISADLGICITTSGDFGVTKPGNIFEFSSGLLNLGRKKETGAGHVLIVKSSLNNK